MISIGSILVPATRRFQYLIVKPLVDPQLNLFPLEAIA